MRQAGRWGFLAVVVGALGAMALSVRAAPPKKEDLSAPFSHDTHFKQNQKGKKRKLTCNDCHAIDPVEGKTGKSAFPVCKTPRMPYPTHDKCIGCHPGAFFMQPLQICTNCHVNITITEKADLKPQTSANAPLRTVFDHRLHLDPKMRVKKRFGFDKDCTFCHSFQRGGEKVSLPAHAQCCDCHTQKNVEPSINDCAGCHKRPKRERNPRSMVKKFSHADHKSDPQTGTSLPCLRCHFAVPKARKVARLQLPKMATCVDCHQGEVAFSYAECLKCHEKGIETKLIPASHKAATAPKRK